MRAALNAAARKLKAGSDFQNGARTRCYTPFTTRTTTPGKPPSPHLHNSDERRAGLEDERVAPPPLADQHGPANRARLTEKFRNDAALQRFADKQAYLHLLNAEDSVIRAADSEARNIFLGVLGDINGLPGIAGTKASAMQGIGMLCVTKASLKACGNDPSAASRALCCLRNIDLLASIRAPDRLPASVARPGIGCPAIGARGDDGLYHFTEQDLELAWKIAQELETTPAGFAALKALTLHDDVAADAAAAAHPSIERHDDMMLHAYLTASREKCLAAASQGMPASAAPHAIACVDGEPAAVLDKGIAQIRRHLLASHEHMLKTPTEPFAYRAQPDEHEWAIGFIRNGLYTDAETVDGKPTAYARIEGRLNKVATWCERAVSGGGKASTAWRRAAPYLLPGHRKSPLNAYNALEAGRGVRRAGVALENATQGIIQDGRAFRDHIIGNIIKALKAHGGDGKPLSTEAGGNRRDPSDTAIGNLARLALLTETAGNTALFPTLLHGAAPDRHTVTRARERIYSWLAGGEAGQLPATRDAVERALSAATRPLTLDRLDEWAALLREAGTMQHAPQDVPEADRPDWAAFAGAVRQLRAGAGEPLPAPHLQKLGDASDRIGVIGDVIEGAVARMELGSKLTYSSGGFAGAGAREIILFLGSVLSLGLLRPRVHASVECKRKAVLEMETSVDGNHIFVGTQRSVKMQAGGGIGVGPGMKIKGVAGFKTGASVDVLASIEHPATHGVKLSLPRPRGMAADQANNILLGRLFRRYVIERKCPALLQDHAARAPGKDGESTLKNLLQACPTLGVGLLDTTERIARENVSAAGGASASVGPFSIGLSAGVSVEKVHAKMPAPVESKAARNVIKSSDGTSFTATLSGQFHALQQAVETVKAVADTSTALAASSAPAVPVRAKPAAVRLLNAMCVTSKEVGSWGSSGSYTLVIEDGAVGNASRSAVMHRDAESFIASVAPRLDRWAVAIAHRFQKDKVDAGEAHRQEAYDRAHAMLSAQLEDARRNGDAQTRYTEIFELTAEALENATALRSAMLLFDRSGDREQAMALSRKLDALLASDDAWMPHLLITQRTSRADASAGIRFGIYAGKTDAVSSSSIRRLG